jgi:hypothetical protein
MSTRPEHVMSQGGEIGYSLFEGQEMISGELPHPTAERARSIRNKDFRLTKSPRIHENLARMWKTRMIFKLELRACGCKRNPHGLATPPGNGRSGLFNLDWFQFTPTTQRPHKISDRLSGNRSRIGRLIVEAGAQVRSPIAVLLRANVLTESAWNGSWLRASGYSKLTCIAARDGRSFLGMLTGSIMQSLNGELECCRVCQHP